MPISDDFGVVYISNNPSFGQKHLGVPDGSDGSHRTLYHLTENFTFPVVLAMHRVADLPSILFTSNVVINMHHENNKCVTLSTGAAVML
jgi:hypothetical protein